MAKPTKAKRPAPARGRQQVVKPRPRRAREKALPAPVPSGTGGWYRIFESYSGAWQHNVEVTLTDVLSHPVVFACIDQIASDFGTMECRIVAADSDGLYEPAEPAAFAPVLRKPNRYQTAPQFFQAWQQSKQVYGNTYILLERDNRGVVVRMYVLDPLRVTPLVADDGSVFYQLRSDNMAGGELAVDVTVPASEIIHDRFHCLYHPLVGQSPIFACGIAATLGLNIQSSSTRFFGNGARPSGILTAPGEISDETAARLKANWESGFSGENAGKTAVVGDGLKYEQITMKATDAETVDQDKAVSEKICTAFRVPAYKVGAAAAPTYNNIEALNQQYYNDCLRRLVVEAEHVLDEGLNLPKPYYSDFSTDDLLRMDTAALVDALTKAVGGKLMTPNEGRRRLNLKKVKGGDTVFAQQQDFSLEALHERDQNDPFAKPKAAAEPPAANDDDEPTDAEATKALYAIRKALL